MRNKVKNIFLSSVGRFSKPKSGVFILNGHFLSRKCNNDMRVSDSFLKNLRNSSDFLNIEDAVKLIESGEANEVDGNYLSFTFDDGFDDCYYSLAPSLNKYDVNACFFINPNYVTGDENYISRFNDQLTKTTGKKPLNWTQIVELHKNGFVIGNHTLDHLRLSELSRDLVYEQVVSSKNIIESHIGNECNYFAWPYGQARDICDLSLDIVRETHKYVFSGCDYRKYYFDNINGVFNRRHFETSWKPEHLNYFLSRERSY
ncbi:Polysaccharide deacetylase family protein [Vibrio crassostreae]|uniref:polysaccharide deacetylase family protein n=1 Tax=Vibrio crassostreae TaxID=246167 RepID=UPI0005E4BF82|nr:polysaccharide deacetylase family protein [Vibrio crassostreae]TCT62619.1 polysaccharide deacetylase [Vibrio crassostreae]TCT83379.1 polysaccharide deacetylase [Vibrio crassostreae]TCU03790.1 polysaccharide deacetylase [Vibrio crassostreae]TDW09529.1 polysaccharide deacetylase [Vibrio crassostreae]CAK2050691.1 Polysaccharide deacetylase family protein [Vibrio crassostreae]